MKAIMVVLTVWMIGLLVAAWDMKRSIDPVEQLRVDLTRCEQNEDCLAKVHAAWNAERGK